MYPYFQPVSVSVLTSRVPPLLLHCLGFIAAKAGNPRWSLLVAKLGGLALRQVTSLRLFAGGGGGGGGLSDSFLL
uniref:Uncharacterized protein n=1 Tax=Oryza glumipatula TaxID=40148 RepID=A0A0E0ACK4_9ORYZ